MLAAPNAKRPFLEEVTLLTSNKPLRSSEATTCDICFRACNSSRPFIVVCQSKSIIEQPSASQTLGNCLTAAAQCHHQRHRLHQLKPLNKEYEPAILRHTERDDARHPRHHRHVLITGFLAPKWIMDHSPLLSIALHCCPLLSTIRSVKASPAKYADKAEAQPQRPALDLL